MSIASFPSYVGFLLKSRELIKYYHILAAAVISGTAFCLLLPYVTETRQARKRSITDPTKLCLSVTRSFLGICSIKAARVAFDMLNSWTSFLFPLVDPRFSVHVSTCQNATKTKLHWIKYRNENEECATQSKDIILYLQGGAYVMRDCADLIISRILLPRLSKDMSDVPVICSMQYELAIESHPIFLKVQREVVSVYHDLVAKGYRVITVMGDSAGAHLAVGALLMMFDEQCQPPVPPPLSLVLLSPVVDMRTAANSFARNIRSDGLHLGFIVACRELYFGPQVNELLCHPYVNFHYTSDELLQQLPPILMCSGTHELLYDDVAWFARRIDKLQLRNGSATKLMNKIEFLSGDECSHNYICFDMPLLQYIIDVRPSIEAQDRIASYLVDVLNRHVE